MNGAKAIVPRWSCRRECTVSTVPSGSAVAATTSRFRQTASSSSGRSSAMPMAVNDGFDTCSE